MTHLLFKAAKTNDVNAARAAIDAGAKLSQVNVNGHTAIDIAVSNNHFKVANYLVFARRIEQQIKGNYSGRINSVQQSSPEAAPIVKNSASDLLTPRETPTDSLITIKKDSAKFKKEPKHPKLQQNALVRQNLKNPQQTKTFKNNKLKTPEPSLILNKSIAQKRKISKQGSRSSAPIFVMDNDGELIKLTLEEVREIRRTIKQRAAISLQDIEPRRPLFIPTPRIKPKLRERGIVQPMIISHDRKRNLSKNLKTPNNKISATKKSHIRSDNNHKSNPPIIIKEDKNTIDRIRPTRRISPELIKKLQSGLERSKQNKKEKLKNTKLDNKSHTFEQSSLEKKHKVTSASELENQPRGILGDTRDLEKNNSLQANDIKERSIFGKFIGGVTRLLGDPDKDNKDVGSKKIPAAKDNTKTNKEEQSIAGLSVHLKPIIKKKTTQYSRQVKHTNPSDFNSETEEFLNAAKDTNQKIEQRKYAPIENSDSSLPAKHKGANIDVENDRTDDTWERPLGISMHLTRLNNPLKNITLMLGNSITTGQAQLPRGIAEPNPCIQKQRGKVSFCIVPVDWPEEISSSFSINTSLYQGTRAIARFDRDKATHFHVLFNSHDHEKVTKFIKKHYGPPTDIWNRVIAPFGMPRRPNPTFVWRSHNKQNNEVTIIEIRKFDDTRTVFPDITHGAFRLYIAGGPPVFPVVTAHDIMSIDWAARSDHLDDGSPIMARTMPVQP